jgi:hypothetical protein
MDPNEQAGKIRTLFRIDSKDSAQMQELVRYITLAAYAQHAIKVAFLNQPIEVSEVRGQFQKAIKLGG